MVWVNEWTPLIAAVFILHAVAVVVYQVLRHRKDRMKDSGAGVDGALMYA
jgi:hypothetical protein